MGPYRDLYVDAEDAIAKARDYDLAIQRSARYIGVDLSKLDALIRELYKPPYHDEWCFPGCYVSGCESTDCRSNKAMVLMSRRWAPILNHRSIIITDDPG